MLSDEEMKAIKEVKHFNELTRYWQEEEYEEKEIAGYIATVLNLIEKQSKEIEELKEKFSETYEYFKRDFTPNDKIKAKIEENKWAIEHYDCDEADYKQSQAVGAWNVLQRLLKESEI